MELYGYYFIRESDLEHSGIKGQKWGVRRFQNSDGTWTAAGKARYGTESGSLKGTIHRNLADTYEINRAYYEKHGNKQLAAMNKKARDNQLAKAVAADKSRANKRAEKLNRANEKYNQKLAKYNSDVLASREKNREKLAGKKKTTKEKLKDFDEGTKYVKEGQRRVQKAVSRYQKMQISAISKSSIKRSAEYKAARKEYNAILRSGPAMSTLAYAVEASGDKTERQKKND